METTEHYYTWCIPGEALVDIEAFAKETAIKYAEIWWQERKADDSESYGELDIEIVKFHYDDEGEKVIDERTKCVV